MVNISIGLGFILAVLFAVVFAVRHLGGDPEFLKRGAQVAIAVLLALTVVSGTVALLRPPDRPEDLDVFSSDGDNEESEYYLRELSERNSERETIQLGLAVVLISIAAIGVKKLAILPLSLMLSGLVLIVITFSSEANSLYEIYEGNPGGSRDVVQFFVLLVGTGVLIIVAALQWETGAGAPAIHDPEPRADMEIL